MNVLLNQHFDPLFWPDSQVSEGTMQYKAWVSGVLGAVIASWALLIASIANYPFKAREKWAWNGLAAAVVFWFIVDTSCSLYYDVSVNAVVNSFTLMLFASPLLITREYFYHKDEI